MTQRGKTERIRQKKSTCHICCRFPPVCACFCEALVWSCNYGDDGRWHVYTQSADSATVTLTINCPLPRCVYVCGVVNGSWRAAGQRYCRIHLIFLPPARHNLYPAAPLQPLWFNILLLCFFAHKYMFLHTLLFLFMLRM